MWTAERFAKAAISLVAVGMSVYHLTIAFIGAPQAFFFRGTPPEGALRDDAGGVIGAKTIARASWLDWVLIVVTATTIAYVWWNHEHLITRFVYVEDPETIELVLGTIFTLVVLEATRRVIGWALAVTAT